MSFDAGGRSSETAFRSLRTANQLRSVRRNESYDHGWLVVSPFERDRSQLRLYIWLPVSSQVMSYVKHQNGQTLFARHRGITR